MRIDILTLFPEMFTGFLEGSLIGAARAAGLLEIRVTNIRDFATGAHRQVDDRPFGGGPGMLLMAAPVVECVEAVQQQAAAGHLVMLTPGGRRLDQAIVEQLATHERLVLVCGRYEGFDERVKSILAPDEISIGDYVLSGGEVAAMVIVDAVSRLVPGVLGDEESAHQDSFSGADRLVEGPQYTRPREYRGLEVPDVLLSGDHQKIAAWRHEQAVTATRRRNLQTTHS
jgi:tRNA (guanine37-N1)-methyltransferase